MLFTNTQLYAFYLFYVCSLYCIKTLRTLFYSEQNVMTCKFLFSFEKKKLYHFLRQSLLERFLCFPAIFATKSLNSNRIIKHIRFTKRGNPYLLKSEAYNNVHYSKICSAENLSSRIFRISWNKDICAKKATNLSALLTEAVPFNLTNNYLLKFWHPKQVLY